ncbi:hypothetical protein EW146_g4041 [Bondarzewia mesenterica]|uniref:Uncharacterized protein n=1 Tax=Bondarzewia mesenterica TaxID=1095465 RepID=A0A4S4LVY3_9AGAM|nr:hypothetical protein EW146_g4041 [Bondarzewia mesenterica]
MILRLVTICQVLILKELSRFSSFEFSFDDGLSPDHFKNYVNELEPELRNVRELFVVTDEFNYGPYEHNPSEYNPSLRSEFQSMAMDSGYRAPANVGRTMENTSSTLAFNLLDATQPSMYPPLSQSALPFISPQHTLMPSAEPETNHQGAVTLFYDIYLSDPASRARAHPCRSRIRF